MIINNYSVHQFILPFTSDSFKINKKYWEEKEAYYYSIGDEYGLDDNKITLRKYSTEKYFNNSALKLLGKANKENKSKIYRRKNINKDKVIVLRGNKNDSYYLDVLDVTLIETSFDIYLLKLTLQYNFESQKEYNVSSLKETLLDDNKNIVRDLFTVAYNTINDLGRRFFLPNADKINEDKIYSADNCNARKMELGRYICKNAYISIEEETFSPNVKELDNYKSKIINYFLDEDNVVQYESCLDDRMFTCGVMINNDYVERLKDTDSIELKDEKLLYQTVFVDAYDSLSCPDDVKRKEDLEKSLYRRWAPYGTLFGVTNYSFISLFTKLNKYIFHLLETSVNIYSDMATIALIERAAAMHYINREDNNLKDSLSIDINNAVYLKEISEQLQGIELFDMLREQMKLDENIEHLKNKLDLIHNQKQERASDLLNIFMTAFSIIALIPIKEEIKSIMLGTEIIAILVTLGLSMFLENKFRIKLSTYLLLAIIAIVYIFNIIM